jgi:branched-chain amino acid transport system ATP-binding protein
MRRQAPPGKECPLAALLDVRSLGVRYGRSTALQGVDLAVPGGSLVGVLGPNGAGKSTLLRTIAGLVAPSAGSITFDGYRIDGQRPVEIVRRGVSLIPEGRGILPSLTVAENLRVSVNSKATLDDVYERFPVLSQRLAQGAGTLSGGEQQMLALARALDPDVRLLLVDEPSLGLAPRLVGMVEDTLRDLHAARNASIVWVEQYASRVLGLADVVYILGRGHVVWAGEPEELRASRVLVRTYLGRAAL